MADEAGATPTPDAEPTAGRCIGGSDGMSARLPTTNSYRPKPGRISALPTLCIHGVSTRC